MENYHRNIRLNYLFVALSSLNLTHGVWMIYLAMRGFSLIELGILEGLYHVASFLMEIPTGAVADVWGRKLSRAIGRGVSIIAYAIMFLSPSFFLQAVGFMITAVSNNLESGAGDALVYDSLLETGKASSYMNIAGRQELTYQIASICAFVAGGLLAEISYTYVFTLSMGFSLFAMISALFFSETTIGREKKERWDLKKVAADYILHIKASFLSLKEDKRILFLMFISESVFTINTALFFYLQIYWSNQGHGESFINLIFAVTSIITGLIAIKAFKIERILGRRNTVLIVLLVPLVSVWAIALSGSYSTFFFILTGSVEGLLIATFGSYINELLKSKERATLLSIQSMLFSLLMVIVFPLVGLISSTWNMRMAFFFLALISTFNTLFCIFVLLPSLIAKKEEEK
ncbi:MAG: MFS transporter [Sphaerochaetaceae bacterium]|nr:MFS transporter [Sphaerochaetaceae bacterium]